MREREKGASKERAPYPNSFSNPNTFSYPNSNPDSNPSNISTIFVRNLPVALDNLGLRGIFSRIGRVEEVSIPVKQRGSNRFGFVKFENHEAAVRSIRELNKLLIRGSRIWVYPARRELSRARHHHQRSVPPRHSFYPKRAVDADLLVSLEQKLAEEVNNLVQLRKALDSILGNFEGLVDSKSVRTIIGVLSEVAENLKAANPSFSISSPRPDPILNNTNLSPAVDLSDKRVGGPGSCFEEDEVVEDSLSNLKPGPIEVEEGEILAKENVEGDGVLLDVEAMVTEIAQQSPDSEFEPQLPSDQHCFSFKSKSKRRRKKSGKSRGRHSQLNSRSGTKRKPSSQDRYAFNGDVKRVKRSIEPIRQEQETEEDAVIEESIHSPSNSVDGEEAGESSDPLPSLDAVFMPTYDIEDVEGDGESTESLGSPIPSPPSAGLLSKDSVLGSPVNLVDSFRAPELVRSPEKSARGILSPRSTVSEKRAEEIPEAFRLSAIKSLHIGDLLGAKVVPSDREEAIRRTARLLAKQKRYIAQSSSEEDSLGSQDF